MIVQWRSHNVDKVPHSQLKAIRETSHWTELICNFLFCLGEECSDYVIHLSCITISYICISNHLVWAPRVICTMVYYSLVLVCMYMFSMSCVLFRVCTIIFSKMSSWPSLQYYTHIVCLKLRPLLVSQFSLKSVMRGWVFFMLNKHSFIIPKSLLLQNTRLLFHYCPSTSWAQ